MTPVPKTPASLSLVMLAFMIAALWPGPELWAQTPDGAARSVLLFPVEIHDTSGEPSKPDRKEQLRHVGDHLANALDQSGRYRVVRAEDSPVAGALPASVLECGGCARNIGRSAQTELVALAMIQKMSSLVLFMEVALQEVATGTVIAQERVSLRGDNEDSFRRAMDWLLRHRLLTGKN